MVGARSAAFLPRCRPRPVMAGLSSESFVIVNGLPARFLMPSKYLGALAPLASLWTVRPSYARRRKIAPFMRSHHDDGRRTRESS
jgi:hypothetical protein